MYNTKVLTITSAAFIFIISVVFCSCYSGTIAEDPELHRQSVEQWLKRTYEDPNDADALRNLAIFYVQANEQTKGKIYLERALKVIPGDPALHFYKGINLEFYNQNSEAMEYYSLYSSLPDNNTYKEMLEGRYLWLQRQNAYSDIKNIISRESEIAAAISGDNSMAVFPLIYKGLKTDYVPLSRGFSEMISIDLAKVKQLKVLERIRIQALLDELQFSESGITQEGTAPRAGKLLRANTIVSGDFDIKDDNDFMINIGSWESATSQQKTWVNKSGRLADMFTIQKEAVFAFLQKSGIDISQEEKEQIAFIPTQNLESFLAFSKGLLMEDAGKFDDAGLYFRKAAEIDPAFGAALSKSSSIKAIQSTGGDKGELLGKVEKRDPVTRKEIGDLSIERMQSVGENITSGFLPGSNMRNPAQEQSMLQGDILPYPPLPPQR